MNRPRALDRWAVRPEGEGRLADFPPHRTVQGLSRRWTHAWRGLPYDGALTNAAAEYPIRPGIAAFIHAEDLPMPIRRIATLAAVPATLLLLVACGSSKVHGTITEKEYKPARTTWTTESVTKKRCTTSRSGGRTKRSCHTVQTGTHRVPHRHAACWQIELDDDAHELCIAKARWDKVRVGDRW